VSCAVLWHWQSPVHCHKFPSICAVIVLLLQFEGSRCACSTRCVLCCAVLCAGVAAGALEVQMPERVAYVYSVREPPGAIRPSQYCTYLRHMVVDGQPLTVQVRCGVDAFLPLLPSSQTHNVMLLHSTRFFHPPLLHKLPTHPPTPCPSLLPPFTPPPHRLPSLSLVVWCSSTWGHSVRHTHCSHTQCAPPLLPSASLHASLLHPPPLHTHILSVHTHRWPSLSRVVWCCSTWGPSVRST
jgi:hypothetical protein